MSINPRRKGKHAECEVVRLLQPLIDAAYHAAGQDSPLLLRTGHQAAHVGGSDISGVPFLAVEVKHCETFCLPAWWRQTIAQAEGRLPILFYRKNHVEFRCRFVWQSALAHNRWDMTAWTDTTLSQGKLWVYLKTCEYLDIEPDVKVVLGFSRMEP